MNLRLTQGGYIKMKLAKLNLIINIVVLVIWISLKAAKLTEVLLILFGIFIVINGTIAAIFFYRWTLISRENGLRESINHLELLNSRLRSQRHEALNHIQIVNGLIELEEYDEVKKYISPLFDEVKALKDAIKTNIGTLDAFILGEMIKGKETNIEFNLDIKADLKGSIISPQDLCVMFKECFENTYLTIDSKNKGKIDITITIDKRYEEFIIKFKDNGKEFPKPIKNEMNIIKITKGYKKALKDGYSFSNCRKIINSVGGHMRYGYSKGNIVELRIPLVPF